MVLLPTHPLVLGLILLDASMTPRINTWIQLRSPRGCLRLKLKNTLILKNSMILTQALPQTHTQIRPMTLGLLLVDQKSMLTKQNTNPGPDIYRLRQRRISPLYPDTGLQNRLGRPILIMTNLNMTQTHLNIGK